MAFADYKEISAILKKFQIRYEESDFITAAEMPISQAFLDDFNFVRDHIDTRVSEYSICESIIYPILKEAYKKYADSFALWSHRPISYNAELTGTPDYLLATRSELGKVVLGHPLLMLVEAKKNNFEEGWGQCLAEMVMAQKINDDPLFPIYGIVSDGDVWQFGRLLERHFTENRTFYTIIDLQQLFGALDFVLNHLHQELTARRPQR